MHIFTTRAQRKVTDAMIYLFNPLWVLQCSIGEMGNKWTQAKTLELKHMRSVKMKTAVFLPEGRSRFGLEDLCLCSGRSERVQLFNEYNYLKNAINTRLQLLKECKEYKITIIKRMQ